MANPDDKEKENYSGQDRGDQDSYERYLKGMDQSMRQKVALTAAHLLGEGRVADMGMGSGSGTLALASLYPRVQVVGVDVNPKMVERAQGIHQLPNLEFVVGDIAHPVFPEDSLDGIFDSSVLHHVTSFNGYDHEAAAVALRNQTNQLAPGGSLIVRDFVAPDDGEIYLDVSENDGDESDDPNSMSTARLLELLATQFRKLHKTPGFKLIPVPASSAQPSLKEGFRRFKLDRRMAAEFLLRKDYRRDWDTEVLEEYTYFSQSRFEDEYRKLGLRLLASIPIHNPWIVKNRFIDKAFLWTLKGESLPHPATNHLIVGEKVPAGQGVAFSAGKRAQSTGFLLTHYFQHQQDGSIRHLVRRPGHALDVIPWFRDRGSLFVLARKGHPRPVLSTQSEHASLDGAAPVGYVTEPILLLQSDAPLALTVEKSLNNVANLAPQDVLSLREVAHYYPSPGGIVEEVRGVHVETTPSYVQGDVENESGFSTGGRVRAIDAHQLLRSAQVGALPDVRLELNVYELMRRAGEDPGPWIGAQANVTTTKGPASVSFKELPLPSRRMYVPTEASEDSFLDVVSRDFSERDAEGEILETHVREYVIPKNLSANTLSCVLIRKDGEQILIGLDEDDFAAAQCFTGSSALWVTPAWRLPRDITSLAAAQAWARKTLQTEYGVTADELTELGGRYHPSAGITPEVVYPQLAPVTHCGEGKRTLIWTPLGQVVESIERVQDGHLRVGALRAAHCLGLLNS